MTRKASKPPFDSQTYWIQRHQAYRGSHQATGLLGSSERANTILYQLRKQALLASLRGRDLSGARVLDAGAGLGDFSRLYQELGARVFGCDVSPVAVEHCRSQGLGRFECGRIVDLPRLFSGLQFDIIHCFDVLYHLLDDQEWEESMAACEAVSARNATWYLTEIACPRPCAGHIRVRGRAAYDRILARYGRTITAERRLHWLLSVSPRLHARFPILSLGLEPLSRWRPTAQLSWPALWTIEQVDGSCSRSSEEGSSP